MPPKKDKCKKQADCGCGCAKKTKRKRVYRRKNYAGARMIGFSNVVNQPFMAPINPVVPVAPRARPRSPSPTIPSGPSIRMAPRPSAPLPDRLAPFLPAPEGPNIRMAPIPSAPVMEAPRPARYSRVARAPSAIVAPVVPLVEPLGRYSMRSRPADTLQAVGAKPAKEKKKALTTTDVTRPVVADGIDTSGARPLKERKSITVTAPSQVPLGPDLVLPRVRMPLERITQETPSLQTPLREHLTELGKKRIEKHPFKQQLTPEQLGKITSKLEQPSRKNEQRAMLKELSTFVEPAPLSRPSMMASNMINETVRRFVESGGARKGAGRPTEKRPEE